MTSLFPDLDKPYDLGWDGVPMKGTLDLPIAFDTETVAIDEQGKPTTFVHDQGGYFDLEPVGQGEDIRREIAFALESMGFEIEATHHEVAQAQHEIDFKFGDALKIADDIMTFRLTVKTIAKKYGMHATFMPKPIFGQNGSGMHTHQSLFRDGQNAFFDADAEWQPDPAKRRVYIDALGIDQAIVVGYSMGGAIAPPVWHLSLLHI